MKIAISVVIPAFNEEKLLGATLARIHAARSAAFAARGWDSEVVVCDNNSSDRTADIARAGGARVVFEPVNQIGRARNTGAAAATGQWIIFVDADSLPGDGLFADVATVIQEGRAVAGGSTVKLDGRYLVAGFFAGCWNVLSRLQRWAPGSFIFCEAAAFRAVGGFNERLYASEEIELFQRLKRHARAQRRTIVILHRNPLITSARKLHLYTPREHARFLLKTAVARGRTLHDPAACHTWYDGRR